MKKNDKILKFIGTWKLVSFYAQGSGKDIIYPFGKEVRGRLIYEPSGRMAVQIMGLRRLRSVSDDKSRDRVRRVVSRYVAYYGSYSVNETKQSITHHVEAALLPEWVGTDLIRHFECNGKYLTLKGLLMLGGVQRKVSLVWERLA